MFKLILLSLACSILALVLAIIFYLLINPELPLSLLLIGTGSGFIGCSLYFYLADRFSKKEKEVKA